MLELAPPLSQSHSLAPIESGRSAPPELPTERNQGGLGTKQELRQSTESNHRTESPSGIEHSRLSSLPWRHSLRSSRLDRRRHSPVIQGKLQLAAFGGNKDVRVSSGVRAGPGALLRADDPTPTSNSNRLHQASLDPPHLAFGRTQPTELSDREKNVDSSLPLLAWCTKRDHVKGGSASPSSPIQQKQFQQIPDSCPFRRLRAIDQQVQRANEPIRLSCRGSTVRLGAYQGWRHRLTASVRP